MCNQVPSKLEPNDFHKRVIPLMCFYFKKASKIRISHAKTVFPFVKGTEYEMSLEASEELFLVSLSSNEIAEQVKERWASIDERDSTQSETTIILDPPVETFEKEIEKFVAYNKTYGDGWSTALKVKIFGNWESRQIRVILIDIGLIPSNYISSSES